MSNALDVFKADLARPLVQEKFARVLGTPEKAQRFLQIIVSQVQANAYLMECDRDSLLMACNHAALSGLDPDPQTGHIYLVPRKGKVQFQTGYKGLMELAFRSKQVTSFATGLVFPKDRFEFEQGTAAFIHHTPAFEADDNPLNALYAYAIARIRGATKDEFVVIPRKEWMQAKAISDAASKGKGFMWAQFPDAAIRKTAIRRLSKFLPMCKELQRVIGVEDQYDAENAKNVTPAKTADVARERLGLAQPAAAVADPTDESLEFDDSKLPEPGSAE